MLWSRPSLWQLGTKAIQLAGANQNVHTCDFQHQAHDFMVSIPLRRVNSQDGCQAWAHMGITTCILEIMPTPVQLSCHQNQYNAFEGHGSHAFCTCVTLVWCPPPNECPTSNDASLASGTTFKSCKVCIKLHVLRVDRHLGQVSMSCCLNSCFVV